MPYPATSEASQLPIVPNYLKAAMEKPCRINSSSRYHVFLDCVAILLSASCPEAVLLGGPA